MYGINVGTINLQANNKVQWKVSGMDNFFDKILFQTSNKIKHFKIKTPFQIPYFNFKNKN